MTALILDAGALIAIERNDRNIVALLKVAKLNALSLVSNGGVVAEVWRGGTGNQVPLARLLAAVTVVPIDGDIGRSAGDLIRSAGGGSAIDATIVAIALESDRIITSDPVDIHALVRASGRSVNVLSC
jgi:predicted nucleic acid-binding protein